MRQTHDLVLLADYFQFRLQDASASGDLSAAWSDAAVERMLALAPGVVGLGTVRNMTVPVRLALLEQAPGIDLDAVDHAVEGPLQVESGRVSIAGCTDHLPDALHLPLASGSYRVRLSAHGLDTLSDDGLHGDDRYLVQVWPAAPGEVQVLKQWAG